MVILRSLDVPVVGNDGTEDTTVGILVAAGDNLEENVVDQMERESLCATVALRGQSARDPAGRDPEPIRPEPHNKGLRGCVRDNCSRGKETA